MDISAWSESQMKAWGEKDSASRIRDVEQTYYEAKAIKPGLFNRSKWQAAAKNFTRLVLIDTQARAAHAAGVVDRAIQENRIKGEKMRRFLDEKGEESLVHAVFELVYEDMTESFSRKNWVGTGVDSNDQAMRLAQCVEYVEAFIAVYLEDPPPEWKGERGGALDDGFVPAVNAAKERVLERAFTIPSGMDFSLAATAP